MFAVYHLSSSVAEELEPLGTKRKFWFTDAQQRRMLFKAEERGTGEDWAEKIACELAALLGLPHVHYELAVNMVTAGPGVICESCAPPSWALVLGNQLMLERDPAYPAHDGRGYKVCQHTIDAVVETVAGLLLPPSPWSDGLPKGIDTALDVFVGYLMLDAWIANQDRHHENWGALRGEGVLYLAPSFDHGASMARNLSDDERLRRLRSKDRGYQVPAFARRARSAFYADCAQRHAMGTLEAWAAFSRAAPQASTIWAERLAAIGAEQVHGLLEKIPPNRISAIGKEFTGALLAANQQRILQGDQA